MSVDMKVPEIRFLGFSGEWVEENLGAVAEVKTGPFGSTLHAEDYVEDGHAIITTEHFKLGELPVEKKGIPQVSKYDYLRLKAYLLKVGDIVFSRVGSVDINAHVTNKQKGWLFSGRVLRVRSKKSIDSEYLHHELSTSRVKKSVISRAVGQTMPSINTEILKITPINFPVDTTEQTQIGNTFQKLDSLINQHQQKHDKLSSIKKAMLVKMFPKQGETTPEIRFKGFSGGWRTSEIFELALFNPKEELPERFKYVDLESVKGTSLIGYRVELRENAPSRAQRLAKKGDVFFQTVRPYQKNNYLFNEVENDYVFSTGYAQLRPYYDANFLLNLVQRDSFVKNVLDNCTGTSYPAINASILAGLEVSYPEAEDEQAKIGNYFQKLDRLINQHQQQIIKLNNIKQACLSKMFV